MDENRLTDYHRALSLAVQHQYLARMAHDEFNREYHYGMRDGIRISWRITQREFDDAYDEAFGPSAADVAGVDLAAERV